MNIRAYLFIKNQNIEWKLDSRVLHLQIRFLSYKLFSHISLFIQFVIGPLNANMIKSSMTNKRSNMFITSAKFENNSSSISLDLEKRLNY